MQQRSWVFLGGWRRTSSCEMPARRRLVGRTRLQCADPPHFLAAPKRQHQSDAEEAVGSGHAVARCCGGAESQACQDVGPIVFPHAHGSRSGWERCRFKPTQSKKAIGSLIGGRGQGGGSWRSQPFADPIPRAFLQLPVSPWPAKPGSDRPRRQKNPIGGALTAPFWLRQHWKPHGLASGQESIDSSSRTNGAKNEGSRRADGQWV